MPIIVMGLVIGLTIFVKDSRKKHGVEFGRSCSARPLDADLNKKHQESKSESTK
ncbi:hypothetical protein M0R79_00580 [Ignavigranum ruoffiae]|uniref:hypothetical protein n=1 Tax=Ignavigranum ruoffiae TaxID=89093 RepID=UPI002045F51E|nr:hypothetical protein [Ignavigranum ruoffiae]UPQ85904.1 hypothetical protein M0R79_00580 [Ignavigranum ruoffiae]